MAEIFFFKIVFFGGIWLAQSVEQVILDLGIMSLSQKEKLGVPG